VWIASSSERSSLYLPRRVRRQGMLQRVRDTRFSTRDAASIRKASLEQLRRETDSPLLEERLCVDLVLADRAGLPCPEGTGRVDLIEGVTPRVVEAGDEERDTEWPDTTAHQRAQ
jgi:hypothetical protein